MYSDEQRFIWDIDSLRAISETSEPPNLLEASTTLYRLLMDDAPLVHKVNRRLKAKLLFTIVSRPGREDFNEYTGGEPGKIRPFFAYMDPYPSFPLTKTANVALEKFLKTTVFYVESQVITIKELVRYCRDVGGGTHQGKPKTAKAGTIHYTANQILFYNKPYPLAALRSIIKITIAALRPIYDEAQRACLTHRWPKSDL